MLSLQLRSTVYTLVIPGFLVGYLPWKLRPLEAAAPLPLSALFALLGFLLCLAGGALVFSAAYYLVRRGVGTPFPLDPPQRMVVAGPYAYIQHPMLVGLFVMLGGQIVWFPSVGVLLYGVLLLLVSRTLVLHSEEPTLRKRFGEDYMAYQAATPRWFPSSASSGPIDAV